MTQSFTTVVGSVPTINQVVQLALSLGYNPRIVHKGDKGLRFPNACHVLIGTAQKDLQQKLLIELQHLGWGFSHNRLLKTNETCTFTVPAKL